MTTGHPSKAALGAARIALLAGVSAAAIFAASSAYAQTPPGLLATDSSTWILENSAGTPIATAGNVDATGKVTTTYGAEGLGHQAVAGDSSATVGGTFAVGNYLVNSSGVPLSSLAGCTTSTCMWAAPTTVDPNVKFVQNTYANESAALGGIGYKAVAGDSAATVGGTFAVGSYAINSATGAILTDIAGCTAITCSWVAPTSVDTKPNMNIGGLIAAGDTKTNDPAAVTAFSLGTDGKPANQTTSVAGGVVYSNSAGNYAAIGPDGATFHGATVTVTNGAGSTTTITDGAIVASDSITSNGTLTVKGLATFGATGNTTIDAGGNIAVVNGFTDTASVTTNVGGLNSTYAGFKATSGTDGLLSTTVSAPGYEGTNAAGATTVVIDNRTGSAGFAGNVGVGGSLAVTGDAGVGGNLGVAGNAAVGGSLAVTGQSNLNGGATIKNNLTVSGPADVSMGNNVVHDVATPIVGTDATNKAYVDKGLNRAYEGTAIALAISQPVFLPGQTFAVRGGWGDYEGQNAFGVSAAGVIARNTFGYGSTVSLDAGIGAGNSSVAGKAGVTVGFGGGSAPLK